METSNIAAPAGFAVLFGAACGEGVPAVIAAAIRLVMGALLACARFLRRGFVLFLFDELEDGTKTLVLGDGSVCDALVLVENGVWERDTLPAELQSPFWILITVDLLAGQAARDLVLCNDAFEQFRVFDQFALQGTSICRHQLSGSAVVAITLWDAVVREMIELQFSENGRTTALQYARHLINRDI